VDVVSRGGEKADIEEDVQVAEFIIWNKIS
jgi:hypothetical protein